VARRILWASLALSPVALIARYVFHADPTTLFVLSALALIPLAWLIGEATDHVAEHTGAGIGGCSPSPTGFRPSSAARSQARSSRTCCSSSGRR
jgi:Ca2+:H+ antiporter